MRSTRRSFFVASLAGLALLAVPALVSADDPPSFKKRPGEEKEFMAKVGDAIVHAARPTAKKISLVEYKVERPKAGRTDFNIKMEFHGIATGTRYVADIVVLTDTSDKDKWEVLNIKYNDNSKSVTGYNEKNVQDLITKFNR
jgi:hypothetical protein